MSIDELLEEFPYGIVVLEGDCVLHVCNYPLEPTETDYLGLVDELKTDPEFDLMDKDFDSLNFCKATGDLLRSSIEACLEDSN